jgi:hypothetical protein
VTARPAVVARCDYDRVLEQRDTVTAERDAFRAALADVMRTVAKEASGPNTARTWAHARGLLAASGTAGAEAAEYQAAYEEWEARR